LKFFENDKFTPETLENPRKYFIEISIHFDLSWFIFYKFWGSYKR